MTINRQRSRHLFYWSSSSCHPSLRHTYFNFCYCCKFAKVFNVTLTKVLMKSIWCTSMKYTTYLDKRVSCVRRGRRQTPTAGRGQTGFLSPLCTAARALLDPNLGFARKPPIQITYWRHVTCEIAPNTSILCYKYFIDEIYLILGIYVTMYTYISLLLGYVKAL